MKILLLAPHPFYQPRGTPIAVDLLARALNERGDEVDILTFHEGVDRHYERVRIYRIRPFIKVSNIGPGFSMKKLYCDVHLFFRFVFKLMRTRYDIVHAIEESAFMAMVVCALTSKPFVYDMDSSMTTQLVNKMKVLRPLSRFLAWMESLPIRQATVVVPMCDALARDALRFGARDVVVLRDIALNKLHEESPKSKEVISLRRELGLSGKIAMYIGNLESYQGIDLMLESFALVRGKTDVADLVVIGGQDKDVRKYRDLANNLGIGACVHFLGPKPIEALEAYMSQADIMISPRTEGVNTPMKVYSYLASGVPVLATDLPTHTQVMNEKIAMLAPAEKQGFAEAMLRLIGDEKLCAALVQEAASFIERQHSYRSFKLTLYNLYSRLENQADSGHPIQAEPK